MKLKVSAVLAVTVVAAACSWGDTPFTIVFKNADGLKSGQPLLLKGVRVGEVTSVELSGAQTQIEARVHRKYLNAVCAESSFVIAKPGGLFDASGERQIVVTAPEATCTAIKAGAVIRGQDSGLEAAAVAAREMALAGLARAKQMAEAAATQFSRSPVFTELGTAMREFSKELGSAETTARLEALKKRAEELKAELEKAGQSAEAQALWKRFEEWYREAEASIGRSGASGR